MTCDVQPHLPKLCCVVVSCNELSRVGMCVQNPLAMCVSAVPFQACEVGPQYCTILAIKRNDNRDLLSFGVSYNSVGQKWKILAIFDKNFLGITWKVLELKTMFKSYKSKLGTSYITKLWLWLQVSTNKKANCARLQSRGPFVLRSKNRSQVIFF